MIRNNLEALEVLEGMLIVLEDESTDRGDAKLWMLIVLVRAVYSWLESESFA
ncbi:hypothetical protein [Adlercreutzia sp. ZJ154]|uniref:hypothetical protein n=1 Tax=Adlercreutzia sp. ZJ154 TaxID=2709790 RepID=UPI0013EA52E6|nr:hypothetical protein [Adlercreutzia sp. ZJ154]